MTKREFLSLMQFPQEWAEWDLYPDELFEIQHSGYEPGHEAGSEHDRNGAFHCWVRQEPEPPVLMQLVKLTFLDPDPLMGADVRRYIAQSTHSTPEIVKLCAAT